MPPSHLASLSAALALLAQPASGLAHDAATGTIRVGHVWMAPAAAGGTATPVIPLLNLGQEPDRLTAVATGASTRVELRSAGRPAPSIELRPGAPLALRGGTAAEALLVGLRQEARPGDRIAIVLTFARAGSVAIDIHVEATPGH